MRRGGLDGHRKPRDKHCRACGCRTATWAEPTHVNLRGHLFTTCWEPGCPGLWYLGTTEAGRKLAAAKTA